MQMTKVAVARQGEPKSSDQWSFLRRKGSFGEAHLAASSLGGDARAAMWPSLRSGLVRGRPDDAERVTDPVASPNARAQDVVSGAGHPSPSLQRKASISEPEDPLEREADSVADRVMRSFMLGDRRSPDGDAAPRERSIAGHALMRKCAQCDDEEKKQTVMPKRALGMGASARGAADVAFHAAQSGGGAPLPQGVRALFEPRFGRDFGGVRVHTDDQAGEAARAVQARAYTVGRDIVFARGEYSPETTQGRRLLAHELTHVVQQGAAGPSSEAPAHAPTGVARSAVEGSGPVAGVIGEQQGTGIMRGKEEPGKAAPPAAGAAPPNCPAPCGKSWVKVGSQTWVSLCDDHLKTTSPAVHATGCVPGHGGIVTLATGAPAWSMVADYEVCGPDDSSVEIGFVQTVERIWWGGVYFDRTGAASADPWQPADRTWTCADNARDCKKGTKEPWITDAGGHQKVGGPQPTADDTPMVSRPALQSGHTLRRLRIDAIFHLWLVAKPKSGPVVFINNWDIAGNVVATIPDDADPCNVSQWQTSGALSVTNNGVGPGASTAMLTGQCANEQKKPC